VDYYEAEFTVDELAQMVFEDLHLPNLEDKGAKQILSEHAEFNTITRSAQSELVRVGELGWLIGDPGRDRGQLIGRTDQLQLNRARGLRRGGARW
jgi:hypothetical protein